MRRRPTIGEQISVITREYQAFPCRDTHTSAFSILARLSCFYILFIYFFPVCSGNIVNVSNNRTDCRVGSFYELTFSSSSSAPTFSSSFSPWAWAEVKDPHQRRGCKRRQSTGVSHVFIPATARVLMCRWIQTEMWNVKSLLRGYGMTNKWDFVPRLQRLNTNVDVVVLPKCSVC